MTMESYYLGNVPVKDGLAIANGSDGRRSLSSLHAVCDRLIGSMDDYDDRVLITD